jgi:uncharacterized protein with GYD domain
MPKYLVLGKYTLEGLKGLRQEGAAARFESNRAAAASMGGTMECFYWAFGDNDVYAIYDFPDDEAAASLSVAVNTSGRTMMTVTKLLTAEQVDASFQRTVDYRPPGA